MANSDYIFLSYSRKDSKFALQLAEDLRDNGFKVWMDQSDIEGGRHWDHRIEDALKNASFVVLIVSPSSSISENVHDEVSFAKSKNVHTIPVVHKKCEIPMRWHRLQFIDMQKDYKLGLKILLDTLNGTPVITPPIHSNNLKSILFGTLFLFLFGIVTFYLYRSDTNNQISSKKDKTQNTNVIYKRNTIVIGNGNSDININQE